MAGTNIKTGIDKLVDMILEKKRLSLNDAAQILGVGKNVVQEWAGFLEEQGVVSLEYTLSDIWIVEKKITRDDVIQSAKDFISEKDVFARKIDIIMSSLDSDTAGIEKIKKKFSEAQTSIKTELATLKTQLSELEKFNTLKKNLDARIETQKQEYQKMISAHISKMQLEEKKILQIFENESQKILKSQNELEANIEQKLTLLKDYSDLDAKINQSTDKFLLRNVEINQLLSSIESDRSDLKKDLEALKKKSLSISIMLQNTTIQTQISAIEDEIKRLETKKQSIKDRIHQLLDKIQGK